jgi:hypothetical protein
MALVSKPGYVQHWALTPALSRREREKLPLYSAFCILQSAFL